MTYLAAWFGLTPRLCGNNSDGHLSAACTLKQEGGKGGQRNDSLNEVVSLLLYSVHAKDLVLIIHRRFSGMPKQKCGKGGQRNDSLNEVVSLL